MGNGGRPPARRRSRAWREDAEVCLVSAGAERPDTLRPFSAFSLRTSAFSLCARASGMCARPERTHAV